jgi:hypothetical protein
MTAGSVNRGIEKTIQASVRKLGPNLKAAFRFGSAGTDEFVSDLSDVDFLYIMGYLDAATLQDIGELRRQAKEYTSHQVDIKPFTLDEFHAAIKGKGSFGFFSGWGLEAMRRGAQPCLYNSGDVRLDYVISQDRIKQDALERAHYYVNKARKILSSDGPHLLRGENHVLSHTDRLKLSSSAVKNILTFCLAYRGVLVYDTPATVCASKEHFGNIDSIEELLAAKQQKQYNEEVIRRAYDDAERVYAMAVRNG